jgi:hypothetical protein
MICHQDFGTRSEARYLILLQTNYTYADHRAKITRRPKPAIGVAAANSPFVRIGDCHCPDRTAFYVVPIRVQTDQGVIGRLFLYIQMGQKLRISSA